MACCVRDGTTVAHTVGMDDGRVALRCHLCRKLLRFAVVGDGCWVEIEGPVDQDGQQRAVRSSFDRLRLAADCTDASGETFSGFGTSRYRFRCAGRRHRNGARLDRVLREDSLVELCLQALEAGRREVLL
jgi:hypothetical protein